MKYSIKGNFRGVDENEIVAVINNYNLWRLTTGSHVDMAMNEIFTFEAWVNNILDKDDLFNMLKPYVDEYGEAITWHECTHDELHPKPCIIAEEYRK